MYLFLKTVDKNQAIFKYNFFYVNIYNSLTWYSKKIEGDKWERILALFIIHKTFFLRSSKTKKIS